MKKASNSSFIGIVILIVIAVAAVGYVWMRRHREPAEAPVAGTPAGAPTVVSADKIDPANDGRAITLRGDLKVVAGAHDTQLGVDADAIVLLRYADMLQWREQCTGTKCTYDEVWSPQLISSKKFREPEGHQNPTRLPVTIARYSAGDLRLGAFHVDPAVFVDSHQQLIPIRPAPYAVKSSQLPSNLAISFREHNGILYAGDPDHRAIGDVRVIYRIVPAGKVEITGIQHGESIVVRSAKSI